MATVRLDQTITFGTSWTDQHGNAIGPPSPITGSISDPTKASIVVNPDGTGTVTPLAVTPLVSVDITGPGVLNSARGSLTITAALVPAATNGTLAWGTPTPA